MSGFSREGPIPNIGIRLICAIGRVWATCDGTMDLVARKEADPNALDAFASAHLKYEAEKLVDHALALLKEYPNGLPEDGFPDHTWDALLVAWLVHLRLLNEFFRRSQTGKYRCASEWPGEWKSRRPGQGFLCTDVVEALNAQVMHLEGTRTPIWRVDVRELTLEACIELRRFCNAVTEERKPKLVGVRVAAERFLALPL